LDPTHVVIGLFRVLLDICCSVLQIQIILNTVLENMWTHFYYPTYEQLPHSSFSNNIVTWMASSLLGNGPVNTSRQNTHKATIEESLFLCNDL
jgi:hypothetical protein